MEYDKAVKKYIELRDENKRIEEEAKKKVAENKEAMEKLDGWLKLKAEKDGLDSIKTKYGTVFWTVLDRASISNGTVFFDYVRENEAWELIEKRAAKVGVREWIKTKGVVPPGVDYVTYNSINVRSK